MEPAGTESEIVIAEIQAAFGTVTRGPDTVSWSECVVLDDYGSKKQQLAARRCDTDTHWSQLIDDEWWDPFPGVGGFSFIELDGFKYYLPPTMIRFVRGDRAEWYPGHLLDSIDDFTRRESHWTREQLSAIAHFIEYMSRHDPDHDEFGNKGRWYTWKKALKRRWHKFI